MAHMIPAEPKEFDARSHEGIVFEALKKLPDSYYVFHSVETVAVTDTNELLAKETDFLVVNKQLGALTIEVKAGDVVLEFDINAIKKAGYKIITPIIITNSNEFESITQISSENIISGKPILNLEV